MRPAFRDAMGGGLLGGTCLMVIVVVLSAAPGGEAFLCPAAVQQHGAAASGKMLQQRSAVKTRGIGSMTAGAGEGMLDVTSPYENASVTPSTPGPLRRVRSFLGGGQAIDKAGEAAGEVLSEIGEALEGLETPAAVSEGGDAVGGLVTTTTASEEDQGRAAGGLSTVGSVKDLVVENKEVVAVVVAGVIGSRYLLVQNGGKRGRGGGRRRRRGGGGGGAAPKSPLAGIGQPRVSPEVAAADLKKRADSLKSANFDVDLDLFGDAVSDLPARPPPPAPPAAEPSPSPADAMKGAVAAASDSAAAAAAAAEAEGVTAEAESAAGPAPVEAVAAAPPAVAAEPAPAAVAEPTPAPSTSYSIKPEKSKRKPILSLFKRDTGPQRSTTMQEALSAESPNVADFRRGLAAVLAESAPKGEFDVKEPSLLAEATIIPEDFEGEAGAKAAAASRMSALKELMETAGLSLEQGAEVVADVVNAMVVKLTDAAVSSKGVDSTAAASNALLNYMDEAGALFVALCPGIALDPQIKYNGTYKRGKLEKVFEAAAKNTLKSMGDEGQMMSLDRLQDLFSIKKSKADSITQKIMMDLMMKMMSEGGGEDGDAEGLEKMMEAMGGMEGMGGMPGMGGMGAGRSPEDHKKEVEALKQMVESGDCPKEEVDALRKMYTDAGLDIDTLVNDPNMEASMDADAKEVVVLLRKLLDLWPKK
ncbi:conserved unknown protein [Ectocarpus siliculosus]|uniref:Uncharacterized protein n=1 Tax=Ectocarpus siliculosus TaxID=2880 RepID=D8LKD4_ECTSI|nr:conserved unknown protein [Ectocarpus siliculosus]|eukprot:CBN76079.1 conserved unknown protein [Ectocarpus siliculosus]